MEPKKYSLQEFVAQAKKDLDSYEEDWTEDTNDFHRGTHTWQEWWNTFAGYFSWEER